MAAFVNMAPNLAHHHARKLAALGLLIRLERQGGKVRYQLAAREFLVASSLLPPEDGQGNGMKDMQELSEAFLHAYERSWRSMQTDEDGSFSFGDLLLPAPPISFLQKPAAEPYPTHSDTLTLRITPERYARLAHALSSLIAEAAAEPLTDKGQACTVAVLAFGRMPGGGEAEMGGLSRSLNSFLDASMS